MTTTLGFKSIITKPQWIPLAPLLETYVSGGPWIGDLRNNEDRHPIQYYCNTSTALTGYNVKNDGWMFVISPALATAPAAGSSAVFCPSQGPNGTLAAGATTTSVVISTALPAAVGVNQLANRGDGIGFKIRIIGLSAGGSGKTEERYIVGNSLGTQPTLTLDSALTFTPAANDRYEILSGRVYFLVSSSAGGWKYYDVATNSMSGNLSVTNLPSIATDSNLISFDELHVPSTRSPGEGYFGNLIATASGATSITGQAAGGDASVLINEYRNFQIRIVTDTGTPTAVGQRRNITSHTAGASPVYTVPAWTVTPSATATYVIENNTDRIIAWVSANSSTYTYLVGANTWDTTTYAARGANSGSGMMAVHPFGCTLDAGKNLRYSHVLSFRGGNLNTLDLFDIAGAATGAWTLGVTDAPTSPFMARATLAAQNVQTGFCGVYCPATEQGRYFYINNSNAPQQVYRFDAKSRVIEPYAYINYDMQPGAASSNAGQRLTSTVFVDGTTKLSFINLIYAQLPSKIVWQCAITG